MDELRTIFGAREEVDHYRFDPFDLLAKRRAQAADPTSPHVWAITMVYAIGDPEGSLDQVDFRVEGLLGVGFTFCALCATRYDPKLLDTTCVPDLAKLDG